MPLLQDHIILSDCNLVLSRLGAQSVDAIITDPPYGLGNRQPKPPETLRYLRSGAVLDTGPDIGDSPWEIPSIATWRALHRVLRPGRFLVAFAGARTLDIILAGIRSGGFTVLGVHGWAHRQGLAHSRAAVKPAWEPIIVASRGRPQRPYELADAIYAAKVRDSSLGHPTVKPLPLMRQLVRAVVPHGGVVLDPYVGSGTTAVAAIEERRSYVAIERDPRYHAIATSRILEARGDVPMDVVRDALHGRYSSVMGAVGGRKPKAGP